MKPVKNYDKIDVSERKFLPVGGYVCVIKKAEVKTYSGSNGDFEKLEICFDIAEGDEKGFFTADYKSQTSEDKKWRGKKQLYVPLDDGSEKDEWTQKALKRFTNAVEDSNKNYHWDWDETKLKGKLVGIIFQETEWEFKGRTGWSAQPAFFTSAENIRTDKYKIPDKKPLKNKSSEAIMKNPDIFVEADISDEDMPF